MAKVFQQTLVTFLVTWAATFVVLAVIISGVVFTSMAMTIATVVSFGLAALVALVKFAVLMFRELDRPVAPAPVVAQPVEHGPPAPPDYGGFMRDLAMAIACGIVVGIAVYLVMRQVVPPPPRWHDREAPDPARIVPGIAGVLVFLGVFFRRLVLHMFPSAAKVPEARAIARRTAR